MTADPDRGPAGKIVVLLAFLVVNLGLFAMSGVRLGGDTSLYLDGARGLLAGDPLTARQPSYLGYIAIVAFSQWISLGLTGLVVMQIAAATLAAAVVFKIGAELGGWTSGLLAVVLLTLDLETNRWHAYVLADSMYASAITIAAWLVYRASVQDPRTSRPQDLVRLLSAFSILLAAALIRPEGFFAIPAAALFWIMRRTQVSAKRWAGVGVVVAGCGLLVMVVAPGLSGNVQAVGPDEMLRNGRTIWDYDGWRLSMPAAVETSSGPGSAGRAIAYAMQHPLSTLTLMAARLGVHFAHVRPYFSTGHNALIVLWLFPVYAFGLFACWRLRAQVLVRWCLAVIGTQALVVALTHADWDGRYLAHVLPLWYPLTACGVVMAVSRWRDQPLEALLRG